MYVGCFCFVSVSRMSAYVLHCQTIAEIFLSIHYTHQNSFFHFFAIIEDRIQYNDSRNAWPTVQTAIAETIQTESSGSSTHNLLLFVG